MSGLNKALIIGFLGRDPETVYTQSGTAITTLSIATTEKWNDKNTGEKKERTEWHRVTFFGKQAETISRYTSKGSQIYVEGKIQTEQYEKDGITRYSTGIVGQSFQFLGGRQAVEPVSQNAVNQNQATPPGGFQPQQGQQAGFQQQQGQQPQSQGGFQSPIDDDIPF